MPFVTESRHAELLALESAVEEIRPHVDAWIGLLEEHVAGLPEDGPQGSGDAGRSYAEHELVAMKRDLGALSPATAPGAHGPSSRAPGP